MWVLTDLGHRVTAVDLSPTLLAAARDAGSAQHHVRGDAEHLPLAADSFDRVVAYNVVMDVADMPAAVREIGRVLRPGGLAMISVVHPLADRGRFTAAGPDAPFVLAGAGRSSRRRHALRLERALHALHSIAHERRNLRTQRPPAPVITSRPGPISAITATGLDETEQRVSR